MKDHSDADWDNLVKKDRELQNENLSLRKQLIFVGKELREECNKANKYSDLFKDSRKIKTYAIAISFVISLILTMLLFNNLCPTATLNEKFGIFGVTWITSLMSYYLTREVDYKIKGL